MNKTNPPRWPLHGVLISMVLLAVGCGGSSDSSPTPAPPPPPTPPPPSVLTFGAEARISTGAAGSVTREDLQMCQDGNRLYAVWTDERSGTPTIYCSASLDGGASWGPDIALPSNGDVADRAAVACDGLTVHVAFENDSSSYDDLIYTRSTDGGATWSAPIQINSSPTNTQDIDRVKLACVGNRVYAAWEESRFDPAGGTDDIFFAMSVDAGQTWSTDRQLNTDGQAAANSSDPEMAVAGNNVYVCWVDRRNGERDVYVNYSNDGGVTFQGADVRVDNGDAAGASDSRNNRIAASDSTVCVVWRDMRDDFGDTYVNSSTDGGATWGNTDQRVDRARGSTDIEDPWVACEGMNVYVVWEDERNDPVNSDDDIYFNRSTDGGRTFLVNDVRIDTDPNSNDSSEPRVCAEGSNVYVIWDDERDDETVLINYSTDGGATFLAADLRIDQGPSGTASADDPEVACEGGKFYCVWLDQRAGGDSEVYARSASF